MKKTVRIAGEVVAPVDADWVETEADVYSLLIDGRVFEARVDASEVVVAGHRFSCELEDPRQWQRGGSSAAAAGNSSITAPMPGKVVRVLVDAGQEVTAGQGIVVVEAMKMQNEMKSPRAGRIGSIRVKAGDSVESGQVLATLE